MVFMKKILYIILLSTYVFADVKYPSLQDIKDNIFFGKPLNLDGICSVTDNMKKIKIKDINEKSQKIEIIGYYDKTTKMPSGSWEIKVDGKYLDRKECYNFKQNFNIYKKIKDYIYLPTADYTFESHDNKNKVLTMNENFETTFYKLKDNQWVEERYYFIIRETSIDYLITFTKVKEYFETIRNK